MILENKRPARFNEEAWTHFQREMRLRVSFQQKEATGARVASSHTSRLGRMGRHGFIATFTKDYGQAPTPKEISMATYQGYRALQMTLPLARPFEVLDETDQEVVAREEDQGRWIDKEHACDASSQQPRSHDGVDSSNSDSHEQD